MDQGTQFWTHLRQDAEEKRCRTGWPEGAPAAKHGHVWTFPAEDDNPEPRRATDALTRLTVQGGRKGRVPPPLTTPGPVWVSPVARGLSLGTRTSLLTWDFAAPDAAKPPALEGSCSPPSGAASAACFCRWRPPPGKGAGVPLPQAELQQFGSGLGHPSTPNPAPSPSCPVHPCPGLSSRPPGSLQHTGKLRPSLWGRGYQCSYTVPPPNAGQQHVLGGQESQAGAVVREVEGAGSSPPQP